ncbi:Elongator complex protein 4 [Spathaspora sp. JA1]|nr:Elongator complex protein 4 [Spathaspora sp. JA1]
MSFRKRSEIIGGNPGRIVPNAIPGRSPIPTIPGRGAPPGVNRASPGISRGSPRPATQDIDLIMKNPGVRPSVITSQPTISTGTSDLDKILLHQGLPLGHSLLIEESGTTDFASVITRAFASQGIMHNRITSDINCHVIVIGVSSMWSNDLPGLYKGSSREQKKQKIKEIESKVSVSNLVQTPNVRGAPGTTQDLKIAWRYGLNKKPDEEVVTTNYEHYNHQFDLTQKLTPGPNTQDISYIPISSQTQIIQQISQIVRTQLGSNQGKLIRIVIPGILNPSIYPVSTASPTFIFPLVHSLRGLLRQYPNNLTLIGSLPLDLYPRDSNLTGFFENVFDSVIHLQPFNQEMSQLIEKAYKNEPGKIQQGLVNIIKVPVLSEKGLMMIHDGEYAFKNGRKKFEIEEWGIPVEDEEEDSQTTKNIDF